VGVCNCRAEGSTHVLSLPALPFLPRPSSPFSSASFFSFRRKEVSNRGLLEEHCTLVRPRPRKHFVVSWAQVICLVAKLATILVLSIGPQTTFCPQDLPHHPNFLFLSNQNVHLNQKKTVVLSALIHYVSKKFPPLNSLWRWPYISLAEDRNLQFCTQIDVRAYQTKNVKNGQKAAWPWSHDPLFKFWDPLISQERLKIETSNFTRWLTLRDTKQKKMQKWWKGGVEGHVTYF